MIRCSNGADQRGEAEGDARDHSPHGRRQGGRGQSRGPGEKVGLKKEQQMAKETKQNTL